MTHSAVHRDDAKMHPLLAIKGEEVYHMLCQKEEEEESKCHHRTRLWGGGRVGREKKGQFLLRWLTPDVPQLLAEGGEREGGREGGRGSCVNACVRRGRIRTYA